tara:strand:+ start:13824 stop:14540 length:717 start_codon:yes stop_codon:yes gene_type:complete
MRTNNKGIFEDETICAMCKTELQEGEEVMCDACDKKAEDKTREIELQKMEREVQQTAKRWEAICPKSYQISRADKMPAKLQELYKTWDADHPKSVYMKGASGIGKTSAAFVLARACHFAGKRVKYWQASDLRQKAIQASSSTDTKKFQSFKIEFLNADLIILDDFGNTAKTAASDEHLLSLLEGVKARGIKTIVTTQYHGKQLVESFHNPSIGMAISNRAQDATRIDLFEDELFNTTK